MRTMKAAEWDKWCSDADDLPITCDPAWARSIRHLDETRRGARPYHVSDADGEALVVGYPLGGGVLSSLTLSPLGLPAACHSKQGDVQAFRLLGNFIQQQRTRWRSIGFVEAFFQENAARAPGVVDYERRETTHVLSLDKPFEDQFHGNFKGATRRSIRRAESSCVEVRKRKDSAAVEAYYEIHSRLAAEKGNYAALYPKSLLTRLIVECPRADLFLATDGDRVIGGAILLDDGPQTFYWHAASDRNAATLRPAYAIVVAAIRAGIEARKSWFNFGGSMGMESLVKFKENWGAKPVEQISRGYSNPLLRKLKRGVGR